MSSLIPMDEMTELKSAAEVAEVAKEADAIHEEQSIAALINQAANAGQHSVICSKPISDAMQAKLKSKGYKLIPNLHAADPKTSWTIAGF